ncbi:MAG: hypothetical protein H6707_17295 [Deltaproteobacteria bacterium]|nr:hypothetical protein [Deltaproteobacteria bacterium]
MLRQLTVIISLCVALPAFAQDTTYAPKVAVVLCKDTYSYRHFWRISQLSSQALVGLANLLGVPYKTVTLAELIADANASQYTSLWFSSCLVVDSAKMPALRTLLSNHLAADKSVLADGVVGAFERKPDDTLTARSADTSTELILNLAVGGFVDLTRHRVRTAKGTHPFSSRTHWAAEQLLTQGIGGATDTVKLASGLAGSAVLLETISADEKTITPYMVLSRATTGRVIGYSGLAGTHGPASCFRNTTPAGFFDNRLMTYVIETTQWLLAGDHPIVGLQLSHAPLTAVARLDGDGSNSASDVAAAYSYLTQLGKETGVTTAYGIVSDRAAQLGWGLHRTWAPQIEALGGAVASHSATHPPDMTAISEAQWTAEVTGSLNKIRSELTQENFFPALQTFINPGNGLPWDYYGKVHGSVELFFTHGGENEVPYASGVMGWDLSPGSWAMPIIRNTHVPDYQWFFDSAWKYSVSEAVAIQRQILNYYQTRIGRGALYNEMWHDYGIGASATRPLYDVNRQHFLEQQIFAPTIEELRYKFHLAHGYQLTAKYNATAKSLDVTLDISHVPTAKRTFLAGMGLRLDQLSDAIVAVTINGQPHHAFTADTVILPGVVTTKVTIALSLGSSTSLPTPRLEYVSKAPAQLTQSGDSLSLRLAQPQHFTKFCFAISKPSLLVGATRFASSFVAGSPTQLCGQRAHGDSAVPVDLMPFSNKHNLQLVASERRILHYNIDDQQAVIVFAPGNGGERVSLRSQTRPDRLLLDDVPASVDALAQVTLRSSDVTTLTIAYGPLDSDGDQWSDGIEKLCGSDPASATSTPSDIDRDGQCDAIDADDDNDGFSDQRELSCGSDPAAADSKPLDANGDGVCEREPPAVKEAPQPDPPSGGGGCGIAGTTPIWSGWLALVWVVLAIRRSKRAK